MLAGHKAARHKRRANGFKSVICSCCAFDGFLDYTLQWMPAIAWVSTGWGETNSISDKLRYTRLLVVDQTLAFYRPPEIDCTSRDSGSCALFIGAHTSMTSLPPRVRQFIGKNRQFRNAAPAFIGVSAPIF